MPRLSQPLVSIVVPVLNEAAGIQATLASLAPLRQRGVEVIVVDGGSLDTTAELARPHADAVVTAARGRARQMNAGAAAAQGAVLLFLHADTQLPPEAERRVAAAMAAGALWGRFDVTIVGRHPMLRVVAAFMNARSRWSGIATGDQALFVRRDVFERLGGFPDQPLMEDIELSQRLRRLAPPACLRARVATSGRRWETRGVWRTIFLMWRLRWRYWRGESAQSLAEAYR
ncbi:MAG: TIGR04283 family arsenosugar biosynthesis glycosyltransferase [Hydrogenophaga sp.]|nr:TIGR04283 family arsenosugar biosynthesis glycosyltransferase [Hydrogenophaga sp.]